MISGNENSRTVNGLTSSWGVQLVHDLIIQGRTVDEIRQAFHDSVEDYLAFCAQLGHEPEKPFTGKLMLCLPPDLHRRAYTAARQAGKSLNAWIADSIDKTAAHAL